MAILDIFKKKKKPIEIKKTEEKETEPKAESSQIVAEKPKKKAISSAYRVLKSPHVTEKATELTGKNQYVFRVALDSNKTEIKKAIEDLYGVEVEKVNITKIPGKKRRLGRSEGWRGGLEKGYKKAIVKLKEGQKIEVLPR